jgi:hypothetical protein
MLYKIQLCTSSSPIQILNCDVPIEEGSMAEMPKYLRHLQVVSSPERSSTQLLKSAVGNTAACLGEANVAAFDSELITF